MEKRNESSIGYGCWTCGTTVNDASAFLMHINYSCVGTMLRK